MPLKRIRAAACLLYILTFACAIYYLRYNRTDISESDFYAIYFTLFFATGMAGASFGTPLRGDHDSPYNVLTGVISTFALSASYFYIFIRELHPMAMLFLPISFMLILSFTSYRFIISNRKNIAVAGKLSSVIAILPPLLLILYTNYEPPTRFIFKSAENTGAIKIEAAITHIPGQVSRWAFSGNTAYSLSPKQVVSAIDMESGTIIWHFTAGESDLPGGAHVVSGDRLFLVNGESILYAIDRKNGEKLWQVSLDREKLYPFISSDNRSVYPYYDHAREIVAIDASNGVTRWKYKTNANTVSRPIITDNLLCLLFEDGIAALSKTDGQVIWSKNGLNPGASAFPVYAKDRFYLATNGDERGELAAFEVQTGEKIWDINQPNTFFAFPIPVGDTLFVPSETVTDRLNLAFDRELRAVNPVSGQMIWHKPLSEDANLGAVFDVPSSSCQDKVIYLTALSDFYVKRASIIRLLDKNNGEQAWQIEIPDVDISETIGCLGNSIIFKAEAMGSLSNVLGAKLIFAVNLETGKEEWRILDERGIKHRFWLYGGMLVVGGDSELYRIDLNALSETVPNL